MFQILHEPENSKTTWDWWSFYHGNDLQILQIRPLGGQELFGDEVRFISREPLWVEERKHWIKLNYIKEILEKELNLIKEKLKSVGKCFSTLVQNLVEGSV